MGRGRDHGFAHRRRNMGGHRRRPRRAISRRVEATREGLPTQREASATDTAPVIEVVREFIDAVRPAPDDMLVLAQATSPFTSPDDFRRLQQSIDAAKADSYIACLRTKRFVWNPDGTPASYRLDAKPMRQAFSGTLIETGAFYASSVGAIERSSSLLSGRIEIVETSPGTDVDIDESIDWLKAEALAKAITMIQ